MRDAVHGQPRRGTARDDDGNEEDRRRSYGVLETGHGFAPSSLSASASMAFSRRIHPLP